MIYIEIFAESNSIEIRIYIVICMYTRSAIWCAIAEARVSKESQS